MSPGVALLLAVAALLVLLLAAREFWLAWEQHRLHIRRTALTRIEAEAATLRYRLDSRLRRTRVGVRVETDLASAGIDVSVLFATLLAGGALAATFVVVGAIAPWWVALPAVYGTYRGLQAYLDNRRGQRVEAFVAQLPELARTISNAAAAGQSLANAIELAGRELAAPAGRELQLVAEQLRIGESLDGALQRLRERMPSREVGVLVTTLLIQRSAGGDLVRALRGMADTLEERKDLRGEIRTITAGAVFTGYAVIGLGLLAVLLINSLQPGAIDALLSSWPGRVAVLVAGGLYAIGVVMIRRSQAVDV